MSSHGEDATSVENDDAIDEVEERLVDHVRNDKRRSTFCELLE